MASAFRRDTLVVSRLNRYNGMMVFENGYWRMEKADNGKDDDLPVVLEEEEEDNGF